MFQKYFGMYFKDRRHGQGEYSWPDGTAYTGLLYMEKKEGYGTFKFPDGSVFKVRCFFVLFLALFTGNIHVVILFYITLPLVLLLCFFNFLCISAYEQGHLEPWYYINAFIIIVIVVACVPQSYDKLYILYSDKFNIHIFSCYFIFVYSSRLSFLFL